MYQKAQLAPIPPADFELPFGCKLSADNRWVKMAQIIPWLNLNRNMRNFPAEKGIPAKSFRMALGALIIKEKLGISDREVVEQIGKPLSTILHRSIELQQRTTICRVRASNLV